MSKTQIEKNLELDCEVTVNDGSYMTCDMIINEAAVEGEIQPDYVI